MKQKFSVSLTLALVLAMLVTAVAMADDVSNNLDDSIDAVAEVMPLNVGGSNGSTTLYIQPRGSDGKSGCNLTGSTTLGVSISSDNTSVATVSPSSYTFTSCGDTLALTVTPHMQGSATISVSQTSNNTGASFNFAPATFTVNVAPPANTAPQVSITDVIGGESYEIGLVPAATCQVTDAEDGNSTFAATLSEVTGPLSAYGLGEQTASCEYTDGGGLAASASMTYTIVDTTDPVIAFVSRTAANANGWNNGDVTVEWSCSDSGSGVVSDSVSQTVSTEGENQSATGTCEDHAGNTAFDTQSGINIDKTAPTANASASPSANVHGWNNTDVTVSFSGTDGLSGIDFCDAAVVLNTEGAGQSASGTCTDKAGNVSASATASGINIDKTAPMASASASPAANANGWNKTDVTVSFSGFDGLSGIDSCSAPAVLSSEASGQSASGTCADKAGNVSSPAEVNGINIDKTAPIASVTGVSNGATYVLGSVPAAGCSTSDALSGVATNASLSLSGGPVGSVTATCSGALDNAGNIGNTASVTYTVIYNWSGFFQPVDNLPILNKAKAGSAIPVKFSLSGNQGLSIFASGYPSSVSVSCGNTANADVIETTITAGSSSLSYDALADQYIYVWKTDKTWAGTCRTLTVKLIDGTIHQANFNFTK